MLLSSLGAHWQVLSWDIGHNWILAAVVDCTGRHGSGVRIPGEAVASSQEINDEPEIPLERAGADVGDI